MFPGQSLRIIQQQQDEHRRVAAEHRLAARVNKREKPQGQARRVFGLRLSFAW